MKVRRFATVFSLGGNKIIDFDNMSERVEFDESVADRSYFTPVRESVKSLSGSPDVSGLLFDFPDGKDNGSPVPLGRKRGVDIAELSENIRNKTDELNLAVRDYNEYMRLRGEFNKDLSSSASDTSSNSSKGVVQ